MPACFAAARRLPSNPTTLVLHAAAWSRCIAHNTVPLPPSGRLHAMPTVPPPPWVGPCGGQGRPVAAACRLTRVLSSRASQATTHSSSRIHRQPIWVPAVVPQLVRRHQPAVAVPHAQAAVGGCVFSGGVGGQIEEALVEGNIYGAGPQGLQAGGWVEGRHEEEARSPPQRQRSDARSCSAQRQSTFPPVVEAALRPALAPHWPEGLASAGAAAGRSRYTRPAAGLPCCRGVGRHT